MQTSDEGDLEHLLVTETHDDTTNVDIVTSNDRNCLVSPTYETTTDLNYSTRVLFACLNAIVNSVVGANVFIVLWFASSLTFSAFQLHIALCGIGYQLLMAHGFLSICNYNGWSSVLCYEHKKRAHIVLQVVGSSTAIAGSAIMIRDMEQNFKTLHGKLALVAMVFSIASFLNGLVSLKCLHLQAYIPAGLSRVSHQLLGVTAFAAAMTCLCFGYLQHTFVEWSSQNFSYVMIALTGFSSFVIVVVPMKKFCRTIMTRILRGVS